LITWLKFSVFVLPSKIHWCPNHWTWIKCLFLSEYPQSWRITLQRNPPANVLRKKKLPPLLLCIKFYDILLHVLQDLVYFSFDLYTLENIVVRTRLQTWLITRRRNRTLTRPRFCSKHCKKVFPRNFCQSSKVIFDYSIS